MAKSSSIYFATTEELTLEDLKGRISTKCSNTSGWKIPINMLQNQTLVKIDGRKIQFKFSFNSKFYCMCSCNTSKPKLNKSKLALKCHSFFHKIECCGTNISHTVAELQVEMDVEPEEIKNEISETELQALYTVEEELLNLAKGT